MFTILLWNDRTERLEHRFSSRFGERIKREHNVTLGEGIIGRAAQQRTPLLVPDVRKDPRYIVANPEVRSELAVPLIYKGKVIGVIDLEHTRVNYYNEDHQTTLSTLAAQVAISIANARLYQRIHEEEQRLERDLAMAREVQLRLLPSSRAAAARTRRSRPRSCPRAPSAATSTTSSTTARRAMRSTRLAAQAHRHRAGRCLRQGRAGRALCGAGLRHPALAGRCGIFRPRTCWPS